MDLRIKTMNAILQFDLIQIGSGIIDPLPELFYKLFYEVRYSPDQPRGDDGRWVMAGGSGSKSYSGSVDKSEESDIIVSGHTDDEKQARKLYFQMTSEEQLEVIQKGQKCEKPVFSYDRPDNKFPTYAQRIPKEANTFDIISHGAYDRMEFFYQDYPDKDKRAYIDAFTLSTIMKGRNDYNKFISECEKNGVEPVVRLLSCSTGDTTNTGNCFAQLFANELGVKVKAPTDILYVNSNGSFQIGDCADGRMESFYPRK